MMPSDTLRAALLSADRRLSKFNPLSRILFFDDFDDGANGWCELIGNHDGNLDKVRTMMRDLRPPQISNCSFFDIGTHGSMDGTYALKLATRPQANHTAEAIKRVTFAAKGLVQFETYFTYKAEQIFDSPQDGAGAWDGNYDPSEARFGCFTISNDVCEGDDSARWMCALRYMNADDNRRLAQQWMYKTSIHATSKMIQTGKVARDVDPHVLHPDDWQPVPNGRQALCYNEVPTKINWHYLRWQFDIGQRRNIELQVNTHVMDLRQIAVPVYDHPYRGLNQLLNFVIDVRTHSNVRNFLYLDSDLVSVDW
jgi:hypothetical protein